MRGVKSDDLLAIVSFLYRGEVNIEEESLDSFLDLAEELDLRGLSGQRTKDKENGDKRFGVPSVPKPNEDKQLKSGTSSQDYKTTPVVKTEPSDKREDIQNLLKAESEALEQLDSRVKLLMEKTQNLVHTENAQ